MTRTETTRPSAVGSNDLLAVTQDLVREIDAVMSSKGVHTRLCDTNIAWHARRVREALTTNSAMSINMLRWRLTGDVGASSNAMAAHLSGLPCSGCYPSDPDDFARCLMLLDAVPALRAELHRMAEVSVVWAAIVARWGEIETTFRGEVPRRFWQGGRWDAPRTMKLMREVIEEAWKEQK